MLITLSSFFLDKFLISYQYVISDFSFSYMQNRSRSAVNCCSTIGLITSIFVCVDNKKISDFVNKVKESTMVKIFN